MLRPPVRRIVVLATVATLGAGAFVAPAAAQAAQPERQTWDETPGGQWRRVTTRAAATTQLAPEPQLDRVEQLLEARQYEEAEERAVEWLENPANKTSPHRDRALLLNARALYGSGDRIKAFYYCDELLDTYPESPLFYPALELQYRIAEDYLEGYKNKFLGMRLFKAEDDGVDMMFRIQARSPGSPLAERALLRTADYYYASSDFDFAEDAYAMYIRRYSRSPLIPRVRLRRAFASLAQFRGLRFDATKVVDAREQLRAINAAFPDLAEEENVPAILERIDRTLAQKLLVRADFYKRTGEDRAAAYTYKYLLKAYPTSAEAAEAERELRKLPAEAQAVAGPESVGDDAAVGQPGNLQRNSQLPQPPGVPRIRGGTDGEGTAGQLREERRERLRD